MSRSNTHPLRGYLLAGSSVALATLAVAVAWNGPPDRRLWFWLAACLAGEVLWVRLPMGRATLSMASACNFAALILLPRVDAMIAAAAASLAAEWLVLRKRPERVLFNAGQIALVVGAASFGFHSLARPGSSPAMLSHRAALLPLLTAAAAYWLANTAAVALAVAFADGVSPWRAWRTNFASRYELLSASTLFSLGVLIAVLYSFAGPLGVAFAGLPLVLAHDSYRRYLGAAKVLSEGEAARQAA